MLHCQSIGSVFRITTRTLLEKFYHPAPFFNCLTQNGDLGGKVGKLTTRLCQLIACAAPITTRGCGCFFGQFWNLLGKMH